MKPNVSTMIFAIVMGIVCSLVLTAVAQFVKPYRKDNEKAERYRNILKIFNIDVAEDAANKDIIAAFDEKVTIAGDDPAKPDYYLYGKLIALPAQGPGLWGPIEGLIGLESDGVTITTVSFYKQEETPGLGGEIATKDFTDRFIEKKLIKDGQAALELVKPGMASGPYQIDAISGATMTCDKVQELITAAAENFIRIRQEETN